jgi:hypothetical protein
LRNEPHWNEQTAEIGGPTVHVIVLETEIVFGGTWLAGESFDSASI